MSFKTMYVYFLTNKHKTVLYVGVTNNLERRIAQHREAILKNANTFCAKYNCGNLVYYETFKNSLDAISREKELKKWSRLKKNTLIESDNPKWEFIDV
ncbi:GIY-YIG nuclease family protein [Belliella marina]|uniref:GIY-YIG nuclease family protein n=1 Tax=Belliella marina TaxID=1644146 RepID=A0ABW4VMT8_9BACT